MASISSLSSGSSIYGSRNSNIISGLASGMDTESMIEGMVQGIKSKIDKQKQQQTILGWQQEAYRSISDQLVSLSTKYTSYTSSTNLMSTDFFKPSIITSIGKYASSISASGSTSSNIEIFSASKAQTESISFEGLNNGLNIGDGNIIEGLGEGINIKDGTSEKQVSSFEGKYITVEYYNETYTINLPSDPSTLGTNPETGKNYSYDSAEDVAAVINKQLSEISVGENNKLSDFVKVNVDNKGTADDTSDDLVEFSLQGGATGKFEITGGSSEALEGLGLKKGDSISKAGETLNVDKFSTTVNKKIDDIIIGSTITLDYNGESKVIAFPNKEEYEKIKNSDDPNKAFEDFLQAKVDKAFGYGRIDVTNTLAQDPSNLDQDTNNDKFNLGFKLNNKNDSLSITSGTPGIVGSSSIFGFDYGATNRINTNKTLDELGIKVDGKRTLSINGVEVGEYTKDTKLSTIIYDINNSDAGVKVSYSSTTNQFVFTATNGGSGGRIEMEEQNKDGSSNLAAAIFGSVKYENDGSVTINGQNSSNGGYPNNVSVVRGEDASITAVINGVEKTLKSGTNSFNIDGLSITVNSKFEIKDKFDESGVTFNQSVDTDKIVDAIKNFVEEYNKMLADLGTAYTTQPDGDYTALTDDQKAEMTEKQIEEYEKKAKEGILFADSDLKSLASDLRFLFSDIGMEEIGITTSTEASDRGKLSIDENKLKAAIEGNLEAVKEAFTQPLDENGTSGGAMPKLKEVLDKYAATTGAVKGILIEKAGSQFSPVALLNNQIKTEMEEIDEVIDKLTDQLNDKIDFYTSKFSKLEVLISQMNSQSSYLSSMSGGY